MVMTFEEYPKIASEVAVENMLNTNLFKTHFYNYEGFVEPIDGRFQLRIR